MKKNLQYKRTDRDITNAFIKLIQSKPFEKITVQDIMEEAMINRSTFYQHFRDKYEIAERLQTYYVDELKRILIEIRKKAPTHLKEMNELTRTYFIENRTVLKSLMKIKTEQTDIIREWNKFFQEGYLEVSDSPNAKVEANLFSNISVGFITYYIENEDISSDYSMLFINTLMNVTLKMMNLENDAKVKDMLFQKMSENSSN